MITQALILLVELVILFFGVAFVVQLVQRRVGLERMRAWMGGRPIAAALKGIAVGFITPFCTYSAIPMLVGLRRAGAPAAGYVAFIVAAPVLDPILFGALILIVGLKVALIYLVVAFVAAFTLALAAERVGIHQYLKALPATSIPLPTMITVGIGPSGGPANDSDSPETCDQGNSFETAEAEMPWVGWRIESRAAARTSLTLLRSMGLLLLIGVGIGLIIEAFVSPENAAAITGNSSFSIPIAAALGTPLYFNTGLFVPIADSLHAAGIGTGPIVALTIAGAGANLPEFVLLSRLARPRLIAILFGYIFTVAVTGGILAQTIAG